MSLSGKHAVVTGGGTGIGLAITTALINAGAVVTMMGRNKERLDNVAKSHSNLYAVKCDVTNKSDVDKAFKEASKIAPITILVNNAGAATAAPFHKTDFKAWQYALAVNLTSVYLTIKAVYDDLKKTDHGRIINIASVAALEGAAYTAAYSAAKHGVMGLTKSVALELSKTTTTINSICPGYTNTDIVDQAIDNIVKKTGRSPNEALHDILSSADQIRLIEPREIADQVLMLCDENNSSINGKAIVIDGKGEKK